MRRSRRPYEVAAILLLALTLPVFARGIRPIPLRAGQPTPTGGVLYVDEDIPELKKQLHAGKSFAAENEALRRKSVAAQTVSDGYLRQLEIERERSADYKADRDAAILGENVARKEGGVRYVKGAIRGGLLVKALGWPGLILSVFE